MWGKRYANILIIITIVFSLFIVAMDSTGRQNLTCPTASCQEVQESSFGSVFGIPIAVYAAVFFSMALLLRLKRQEKAGALVLWAMLGAETYMTFISLTYIQAVCIICMIFLVALLCCVALTRHTVKLKTGALFAAVMFFGAHFVFFYPDAHLKATLMDDTTPLVQVEVFASPTCTYCEKALSGLREICQDGNVEVIVRPVSLGDKRPAVEWVANQLFAKPSGTSLRMAEKVVRENEREARNLTGGKLIVPVIRVTQEGEEKILRGWNDEVRQFLTARVSGMSLVRSAIASADGNSCAPDLSCTEPLPFWNGLERHRMEIN